MPSAATTRPRFLRVRREAEELLDRSGHDPFELAANLRDIRRVNRLGGGTRVIFRHLPRLLASVPEGREVTILDLATGSGDIPHALLRWARRRARPLRIVASDASDEILALAARHLAGSPEVTLARFDARTVPLPDDAFDIVLCSLALHHFPPTEAVAVLREMDRLGRHGFILNDIRRGLPGFDAAWISSRLGTRNRLTRHDMPLSVRRAYTPTELESLLVHAGVEGAAVTRHPLFRMAAVRGRRTED
jgi:SAM-dependent methyltransferase